MKMRETSRAIDKKLWDNNYLDLQIELLRKYGMENPHTHLNEKLVDYQLGESIEIIDPHTQQKVKKPLKPFMVNNSVLAFEREKIVFNHEDKVMIRQFGDYRRILTANGRETFSNENEHTVDAVNLCLLLFEQKYGVLFKRVMSTKILPIADMDRGEAMFERKATDVIDAKPIIENRGSVMLYSLGGRNRSRGYSGRSTF